MNSEEQRLIESVTRPLATDPENLAAAQAVIQGHFVSGHPAVAETLARLEASDSRKFPVFWQVLPWVVAVVFLAVALFPYRQAARVVREIADVSPVGGLSSSDLPTGLSDRERLLLGDPSLSQLEQKRQLHLSDPGNPAYFQEYVLAWTAEKEGLPPDFLETAARIDPDNAFSPYYAAAQIGRECIERKKPTGPPSKMRSLDGVRLPPLPRVVDYGIKDRAAFDQSLELIRKASALPGFETYSNEMIAARIRLLPVRTMPEFARSLGHVYAQTSALIGLRKVTDLLCARADELADEGSKEEFLALVAQRDALVSGLVRNRDIHLVNELVVEVIATETTIQFRDAAERLGLGELAETYRQQQEAFQQAKDRRAMRAFDDSIRSRGSSFGHLVLSAVSRMADHPPRLLDSDLEPLRMTEHEFFGGLGVLTVALLLLPAAFGVFLLRFATPRYLGAPAERMARVLAPADWAWVVALGIVLPIASFLVVSRLSPLSGRDYGILHFLGAFPGIHLATLWIGLLVGPLLVVRWRLSRRLAPFGFVWQPSRLLIAAMVLWVAWPLSAFPLLVRFHHTQTALAVLAVPPLLIGCLLLARGFRSFRGPPVTRLSQAVTLIAVPPAYAAAVAGLCLILPVYHSAETTWLARDTLLRVNPDPSNLGAYEFKVAAQKRKETAAILRIE